MVILSCGGVNSRLKRPSIVYKLPVCVRFCPVTEQKSAQAKRLLSFGTLYDYFTTAT